MSQEAERERERLAANESDAKESAVELQSIFDAMHDAIINAVNHSDIPELEKGDIFGRLEMAYRHVRAEIDTEFQIRRQANAVNAGFLRSLDDFERAGRLGWGTTAAFLAKIGVPVRPLKVPESERWLYNLEAEKRGVSLDQLARGGSVAVQFVKDPDFSMWFGDESYRSAPEPANPVTIEGVEYPVCETAAWQPTMPQAFPGTMPPFTQTVTMGDSPADNSASGINPDPKPFSATRSFQGWVDQNLPVLQSKYADAAKGTTIDDLAKVAKGEAKVSAYQGSIKSVEEIQQETAEQIKADMKRDPRAVEWESSRAMQDRQMRYNRWRELKIMGGDYLGYPFKPSYMEWLSLYPYTPTTMPTDVLAEGVVYGFTLNLQHSIMTASSDALTALHEASRWVGGQKPSHHEGSHPGDESDKARVHGEALSHLDHGNPENWMGGVEG